jgi:hypothetical protein
VEDPDSAKDLSLQLSYDSQGNLHCDCDCSPDRPGSVAEQGICRHGIALLLDYAAAQQAEAPLLDAAEKAVAERIQSAQTEVRVEPLSAERGQGAWRAWSVNHDSSFQRRYRVHIRSLNKRVNFCTCPDFEVNQLGTCKHIEAVLQRLQKQAEYAQWAALPVARPFIYLDWSAPQPPQVRLHRTSALSGELDSLLNGYFDDAGLFRLRLPEDFLRLADLLDGLEAIDLGEDALAYARRLAQQQAQRQRAETIQQQIRAGGGRIPGIRAQFYPYQIQGIAFLAAKGRALLADDMGLGKTLQAIAAALWLRQNAGVERVLVVCPASLKHQWAREIERFSDANVVVIQGNAEQRGVQYRQGPGFYIANYELILRDASHINQQLLPDLVILDEAQRIKNWRTKIATAVKQIRSRYAFVLSGTPLENRLEDLYSLMQVVDPHVLGPLWRYLLDFHISDERGKVIGYRNLSELRRRLQGVMLRRDRRLVRDQLPERIDQRIDIELTETQWDLHNAALSNAGNLARIAQHRPLTPSEKNRLMAALQAARMACNAAGLVDKQTQGSPKLDELDDLLEQFCLQSGLKLVIFSQWERMTQMVQERVSAKGLGYVRLHGGVATAKRGELLERFRDDPACQVFITTDAGATGLNLQSASVLINLDVPWNPAVLEQRNARIHRLGQTSKVLIVNMIAAGAYEESVLGILQGKRDLFDNVVEDDASEDVVGVSEKLLASLLQSLEPDGPPREREPGQIHPVPEPKEAEPSKHSSSGLEDERLYQRYGDELAAAVREQIIALQQSFGARIEQILGLSSRAKADSEASTSGGDGGTTSGGLMLVLDRVEEADEDQLADLPGRLPVALIDRRTFNSLQRLGEAAPTAQAEPLFSPEPTATQANPLQQQAAEKLKAARLLLQQDCPSAAAELLRSAALAAAAQLAGDKIAPSAERANLWLYAEIIPNARLPQEQISQLSRIFALSQSGQALPDALLQEILADTQALVESSTQG